MVLIKFRTLASPSATIFSGMSAASNNAGVALFTPASVACADSTTATSKVKGLMCCSSPLGAGCAAWKRRNASSASALVHCGSSPCAALLSAAACLRGGFGIAALPFFAAAIRCLVAFFAMFLYNERHEPRQRSGRPAHHLFGDSDAAPLARPDRLCHPDGLPWRRKLRHRDFFRPARRLAGLRFSRPRCAVGLSRLPRQLPCR